MVSNGYTSRVQGHTGLTHPFTFLTLGHSGAQDLAPVPECQKIKGGLDQYGAECLSRLIFATIRKSVRLKGLIECRPPANECVLLHSYISSFAPVTFTFTRWPWHTKVTYGILWTCSCISKTTILGQGFQKLDRQIQRQTRPSVLPQAAFVGGQYAKANINIRQ